MGQVPYRDFRFAFPPVSIYKEAALLAVLGDSYTILVSRWAFVIEVTIGSVLAYIVLTQFMGHLQAFLLALPTIFFSILAYYFSNYTYDGEILAMAAVCLLLVAKRPWMAYAAGVFACLAVLAKPTFAGLLVVVPAIALAARWLRSGRPEPSLPLARLDRYWPHFVVAAVVAFGVATALFAVVGAGKSFLEQAFLEVPGATSVPPGYDIWQDLPTAFLPRELKLFGFVFLLLCVAALPFLKRTSWVPVTLIPLGLGYYGLKYFQADSGFIPMAMGLLLVIDVVALVIAVAVRRPALKGWERAEQLAARMPPPALIALALGMQYLAQFTLTGIIYSYLGAFLSLPVAIWTLYALAHTGLRGGVGYAAVPATMFGLWAIAGSINYVHHHIYFYEPRSAQTAQFTVPKLAGVSSTPDNVRRIDALVQLIDVYSKPGDPILAFTDFACIYYLTDRVNPTNQDWYLTADKRLVSPSEVDTVLTEVQRDPPRVVLMQKTSEFDWQRTYSPDLVIDYSNGVLAPLHAYFLEHYRVVATVDDITVMVPDD